MSKIQIIDPTVTDSWDRLLLTNKKNSFFHSSGWARVLSESYNYIPLFFSVIQDGRLEALVPCMEVSSIVTGKRGVSLPFTDYCEPIVSDEGQFQNIFQLMIEYGKRAGWKYIEMRPGTVLPGEMQPSSFCFGHMLDLSPDSKEIFAGFRDSTRRNIKRAKASDLQITVSDSDSAIEEFYRLNCMTRRDHGLPPQPFYFFEKIYQHILSKHLGMVVLASYRGTNVAGAVYFHFHDNAIYKYGASDKRYQHFRANNLVMWEALQWYCQHGYKTFDFGRTEPENAGLLQFKRGWGAREDRINYYKYDLKQDAFIEDSLNVSGAHNHFLRRMPIPLLKLTGSILYRHMG